MKSCWYRPCSQQSLTEPLLFIISNTKIWNSFNASTQYQIENIFKKNELNVTKIPKANWMNGLLLHLVIVESIMNDVRWTGSFKTHQWPKTKNEKKNYYFRMNVSSRDLIRYCQLHSLFFLSILFSFLILANRAHFVCVMHCRSIVHFSSLFINFSIGVDLVCGIRERWLLSSFFFCSIVKVIVAVVGPFVTLYPYII